MQLIDNTLNQLTERRDEIEAEVTTRRQEVETELASKVAELNEINGFIKAIEKQQTGGRPASGPRAPRGQNRDKILAVIATKAKTTSAICDETGIGRGSAARTLNQLVDEGAATKTANGRYIAAKAS